ncbi:MAG: MotA/TolQ/ExbB proton channel family protein [Planctomycetota bacterium]
MTPARPAPPLAASLTRLLTLAVLTASVFGTARPAVAQDAAPEPIAVVGEETPADSEAPAKTSESFLRWMLRASGAFGVALLLLSFLTVTLVATHLLRVQRGTLMPADFLIDFSGRLESKDLPGAYELTKKDDSFIARVLTLGLARLHRGVGEANSAMREVGEDEAMGLEHQLGLLALIASLAPMVGLMGTVYGMILSFKEIKDSPSSTPDPSELADGIATALFTTLEGLAVAIPATIAYVLLRNRTTRLVNEVAMRAESLINKAAGRSGKVSGASES